MSQPELFDDDRPELIEFTFIVSDDVYLDVLLSECPLVLKIALISGMKFAKEGLEAFVKKPRRRRAQARTEAA